MQTAFATGFYTAPMDWDSYAEQYRQLDYKSDIPPALAGLLSATSGSLLDMGCGEGALLDRLRARFSDTWTMTGFEVSALRADLATSRGHRVLVDADGNVPSPPGSFDLVISSHVIEHVADDLAYAAQLASLTKPGGHVYLETPVRLPGAWYFRRNPEAGWVLDPTHVREYRSSTAATAALRTAGLEVVSEQLAPIAFPVAAAEALVRRALRLKASTGAPSGLRAKELPIPRYREIGVLTRRPLIAAASSDDFSRQAR